MDMAGWLTPKEVAQRCGVPMWTIGYWRRQKVFKRVLEMKRPTGRPAYWYPADEVERLEKETKPQVREN